MEFFEQPQASKLPSGFKEVKRADQTLTLIKENLPWLDKPAIDVPLVQVTLSGTNAADFFYGSAIRGKKLVGAAAQLNEHQSRIANNLLYSHLPKFIQEGHHPYIKLVAEVITDRAIHCVYNSQGQRVYFMVFDKLQGMPAIIRIAVCDKSRQADIVSVLTTRGSKGINRFL